MKFARLFQPCRIGRIELDNRVVMPPMTTSYSKDGFVTDCQVDYYAERARNSVGLIIVEDAIVESTTGSRLHQDLFVDDDMYLPGLKNLAQAIKARGTKVALNLSHGGRQSARALAKTGKRALAPSGLPEPEGVMPAEFAVHLPSTIPRELEIGEIQVLEDRFADGALRARNAGFDLVSLHAAHSYLINQFLSPAYNQRRDIYGGDVGGRIRFLLEIIRKIRRKAGDDFPIMVRIPGEEHAKGGMSIADCQEVARRIEAAGVDCISVSVDLGLTSNRIPPPVAPPRFPRGCMVYLAAAIRQVVSIPVMTAQRILTPQLAEKVLVQGKADLIGVGRGLIADPEWAWKAREGREEDIRHCIGCMHCSGIGQGMRCSVNAATGRESSSRIVPAAVRKTVLIAGGGPAGMEAARVAALRGHRVTLFEKDRLGGQLNVAKMPPWKAETGLLLDFERRQLTRLGVTIQKSELTPEDVVNGKPDAVIVATGARLGEIVFPGGGMANVVTSWQVLGDEAVTGDQVAVIGGGQVGAETAEYLAKKGRKVTLIGRRQEIASDAHRLLRLYLLRSLTDMGVTLMPGTTVTEFSQGAITVESDRGRETIAVDTVVTALRPEAEHDLTDRLKDRGIPCRVIGDCAAPRSIFDAIHEGFRAALEL